MLLEDVDVVMSSMFVSPAPSCGSRHEGSGVFQLSSQTMIVELNS